MRVTNFVLYVGTCSQICTNISDMYKVRVWSDNKRCRVVHTTHLESLGWSLEAG